METIKVIEYTDCSFKETPEYLLPDKYYTNISLYYYKEEVVNIEIERVDNNFYASVELLYYGYLCSCGRIVREEEIYGKPAKEVAKIIIEGLNSGKSLYKIVQEQANKKSINQIKDIKSEAESLLDYSKEDLDFYMDKIREIDNKIFQVRDIIDGK